MYANNNLHRLEPLLTKQFVTVDQVDRARTSEIAESEALKQAESQLRLSQAALQSTLAQYERSGANVDESKAQHQQDLVWRSHIVGWQLLVRAVFLTQIALWKYRARLPGFELPEPVHEAQKEFDHQVAITLDSMADRMEGKSTGEKAALESSVDHLAQVIRRTALNHRQEAFGAQLQAFLILSRRIESLLSSLVREI